MFDTLNSIEYDSVYADEEIVHAIQEWSNSLNSCELWITGIQDSSYPSSTSPIAANVVLIALQLRIPVLCFFCNVLLDEAEGEYDTTCSASPEEVAAITFVYSLIRQVIELLPKEIQTSKRFTKSRFGELDGSIDTFDEAFSILSELLPFVPIPLFVVVDGIEKLDETEVEDGVLEVLKLLQDRLVQKSSFKRKIIKILCTTAGYCSMLGTLDYLENVEANPVNAQRAGGLARRQQLFLDLETLE